MSRGASARILFVSFLLFVLQIILFRLLGYTLFYLESLAVISYSLLGIGLGGLAAAFTSVSLNRAFLITLAGTWLSLLGSLVKILLYPSLGFGNVILAFVFFFPGFYLAKLFRELDAPKVYFFDLLGCFAAVGFLFLVYDLLMMEDTILCLFLAISATGLFVAYRTERKPALIAAFGLLLACSIGLAGYQWATQRLNVFLLAKQNPAVNPHKSFDRNFHLVKSYDNLLSRIDVLQGRSTYFVSFDGFINDNFNPKAGRPELDTRIPTTFLHHPTVLVMGSSAEGILKTVRGITDPDRIDGIEINPAIVRLMSSDFVQESGAAYSGLRIRVGHALSYLRRIDRKFDIITMMNLHSMPNISYFGPPDFAHTLESYELYLSHLTDDGFLMLEERTQTPAGEAGAYRLIHTLYRALEEMGVPNPQNHFFIYSWKAQISAKGKYIYKKYGDGSYVGIFVKRSELTAADKQSLLDWLNGIHVENDASAGVFYSFGVINYLGGQAYDKEYGRLFQSIAGHRLSSDFPNWNLSVLTNDRPYSSQVDPRFDRLTDELVEIALIVALCLLPVLVHSLRLRRGPQNSRLLLYQLAIGAGYILSEMLFMSIYQKAFVSPSLAFMSILSILFIFSALGARFLSDRIAMPVLLFFLAISLGAHALLPSRLDMIPLLAVKTCVILSLVAVSGLFLGCFFPAGIKESHRVAALGEYPALFRLQLPGGSPWSDFVCIFVG